MTTNCNVNKGDAALQLPVLSIELQMAARALWIACTHSSVLFDKRTFTQCQHFFFFFFFTKAFFTFIKVILNVWLQGVHHRSDTGRQIGNIGACFHLLSIPALHSTKSHAYSQHVPQIVQIIQDSTKDVFLFFFKFHAIQDIFTIFKK